MALFDIWRAADYNRSPTLLDSSLHIVSIRVVNVRIVPLQERQQKRYRDKSRRKDSNTENKDAPNPLNSSVTNETEQRHFFITSISFHCKTPYHNIGTLYFNLSHSMFVAIFLSL